MVKALYTYRNMRGGLLPLLLSPDMIASSHSVGFQEACLQVLQKPVESIHKPVLCASILELMEWKARRTSSLG